MKRSNGESALKAKIVTEGSFLLIDSREVGSEGGPYFAKALIRAAFESWGEDYWIVRRQQYRGAARTKHLTQTRVAFHLSNAPTFWTIFPKKSVLSSVFQKWNDLFEDYDLDYEDERYLFLDIRKKEKESLEEALTAGCVLSGPSPERFALARAGSDAILFAPPCGSNYNNFATVMGHEDMVWKFKASWIHFAAGPQNALDL